MSRTSRFVSPNWNPDHPRWSFGEMTRKCQTRDRVARSKHGKFSKGMRNSRYNLRRKNEVLALMEELEG